MRKAKKRTLIEISSSSSSSSEEESEGSDSSYDDNVEEISSSTSCHDEDSEDDDDEDDEDECKDEESSYDRVIQLLRDKRDLWVLTLMECKAYLRRHRLRLSGSRAECIERIQEHWRLKDGHGEVLYPKSAFTINCTGDVCKGDVVLFTQKVYKKFDKVCRGGDLLGRRSIAGKIVKESYGAAKQQHTFTVEVLWSKGVKKLPTLYPLLIKGRNLYRMKTFRQPWKNEKERLEVLEEKHKRGAAARSIRQTRQAKSAMRQSTYSAREDRKHQKTYQHSQPSKIVRPAKQGGKQVEDCRKSAKRNKNHSRKATLAKPLNMKKHKELSVHTSHPSYPYAIHDYEVGPSSSLPFAYPRNFTQKAHYFLSSSGTLSSGGCPDLRPMPTSVEGQFVNFDDYQRHAHPSQRTVWRNSNPPFQRAAYFERTHYPFRF